MTHMKTGIILYTLTLALTICAPVKSYAISSPKSTYDKCVSFLQSYSSYLSLDRVIKFSNDEMATFEFIRSERILEMAGDSAYKVGASVNVNDSVYTVVEFLGSGFEGSVYRVRDSHSAEFTLKEYRKMRYHRLDPYPFELPPEEALSNHFFLDKLASNGIPTIIGNKMSVDMTNYRVVYQYVHGLPVDILVNDDRLSGYTKQKIALKFKYWWSPFFKNPPIMRNTVFEFATGKFYLIDSF